MCLVHGYYPGPPLKNDLFYYDFILLFLQILCFFMEKALFNPILFGGGAEGWTKMPNPSGFFKTSPKLLTKLT